MTGETLERKERFPFGENWALFLENLDGNAIAEAIRSLAEALDRQDLTGLSFLDVGSGSGLSSLAARTMGAKVTSFDFDPRSAACTEELRRRYFPGDGQWRVEVGSALDTVYLQGLEQFDIVYSWGVLHHTGRMWEAFEKTVGLVKPGGLFLVALYNDQGWRSTVWGVVKRTYCLLPESAKWLLLYPCAAWIWGPTMIRDLLRLRPMKSWRSYSSNRGMSPWRDVVDWVGGYPFEVAGPEEVIARGGGLGFTLLAMKGAGKGSGCNEFLFRSTGTHLPERRGGEGG